MVMREETVAIYINLHPNNPLQTVTRDGEKHVQSFSQRPRPTTNSRANLNLFPKLKHMSYQDVWRDMSASEFAMFKQYLRSENDGPQVVNIGRSAPLICLRGTMVGDIRPTGYLNIEIVPVIAS
ncbi:hypothetical protein BOTBODRAFT_27228 [Botryobasidium botryosum FD-172 SS1]|uniref:Uncharacterized protein n=1 Tax=Botryobasidium botryosum (strain FD-172 SS1) TaxID=930990 RepID=A0A067MVP5_BOTB1|nr:hypothetical protein BOTBODRAFT_27228 [Botryobasidium botryosum FD-172 SS1]